MIVNLFYINGSVHQISFPKEKELILKNMRYDILQEWAVISNFYLKLKQILVQL